MLHLKIVPAMRTRACTTCATAETKTNSPPREEAGHRVRGAIAAASRDIALSVSRRWKFEKFIALSRDATTRPGSNNDLPRVAETHSRRASRSLPVDR